MVDAGEQTVTYDASKPGRRFIPDGNGGGVLELARQEARKGAPPVWVTMKRIPKDALRGRDETELEVRAAA
jgi:hypothetical protein